jgi:hypothetical protein
MIRGAAGRLDGAGAPAARFGGRTSPHGRLPGIGQHATRPGGLAGPGARIRAVALAAGVWWLASGHIGDTNTHFVGAAGPYRIQVTIRHPGVVPGLADIRVRVDGDAASRVRVRPVPASLGLDGAPRPDDAKPVAGAPGLWSAELWFMTLGAYSVLVDVDGAAGAGSALVPVASIATRTLDMGTGLRIVLVLLGLLLALGLVTIVRAAVREAVVAPGLEPDARRRRRSAVASAVAVAVIVLALVGGRAWWNAEADAYAAILFVPLRVDAVPAPDAPGTLVLRLADRNWLGQAWSPLVPDHGRLMHAFLVRLPDQAAFAHVHPVPVDGRTFRLALPPLPPGRYALYADITHESGFAQTLATEVDLPLADCAAPAGCPAPDPDDAWWTGRPAAVTEPSGVARFEDGFTLAWEAPAGPIEAGVPLELVFAARGPDGRPAALHPYMGMPSHAVVRRSDGAVFVHLHPTGSFSMAAQAQLLRRAGLAGGAAAADEAHDGDAVHDRHDGPVGRDDVRPDANAGVAAGGATGVPAVDGRIRLPYAFPQPGRYRVWVQVRDEAGVRTAAWDVEARAAGRRR